MSKRILALLLCAIMIVPLFAGCSDKRHEDDKGPYITMYLSDDIYDFDPINAFYNQNTANVVGMLFDTLFTINEQGKVEGSLAKKYSTDYDEEKDEYIMEIHLKEAYWSNGTAVTADDVVYAWKRLLRCDTSHTAAALLYDIKNARLIKEGGKDNVYVDELGVEVAGTDHLIITFEGKPDYDQFMLNLTSVATAPLLESAVSKNADWAKKGSTIVTSGPYKLGKIIYAETEGLESDLYGTDNKGNAWTSEKYNLTQEIQYFYLERNAYYNRDIEKDEIDEAVTNYRLLVDCTKTDAELLQDYKDGKLFYMGDIPLSIREDEYVKANAQVSDALSTVVCYLNANALVDDGSEEGYKLFDDVNVRKALSQSIDREAIAKKVVYAKAATALVAPGVFDTEKGTDFRSTGGILVNTTTTRETQLNMLLSAAGIGNNKAQGQTPASSFSFTIKVSSYNDVHIAIANMLAEAWGTNGLGFKVKVEQINPIQNNDYFKEHGQIPTDACDDLLVEDIQQGDYEIVLTDSVAYSADPYSVLANFASSFSGSAVNVNNFDQKNPNSTGYDSEEYNNLIEAVYYVPYFASLSEDDWDFLGIYNNKNEFKSAYNTLEKIYEDAGITPSKNPDDWAAQRATLLHKAEKLLMIDVPVIPIVFNQNAILMSEELTDVSSNYYMPAIFTKTDVKNFDRFCYTMTKKDSEGNDLVDNNGEVMLEFKTIFDEFPFIKWDLLNENTEESTETQE